MKKARRINLPEAIPKIAIKATGVACIGVGIVGLFVPIIPGVLFLVAGAALLGGKKIKKQASKAKKKIQEKKVKRKEAKTLESKRRTQ